MTTDRFLHTWEWRRLRDRFFRANPRCRCGRPGVIVDHRIPRSAAPHLKLEWSNLETLCRTCHGEKSGADQRGEAFRVRYGCDEAGTSLDPTHPWNVGKTPAGLALLERKPSREMWAHWFADIWGHFGWTTGLHLRRIHYVLVSQEIPVRKPDGTPYENTENDWNTLGRASLAARYRKLVSADGLIDRRNPEPIIHAANKTIAGTVPPVHIFFQHPQFDYELPADLNLDDTLLAPSLGLYVSDETLPDGQPYLVELWVEKTTQNDILEPLAHRLGVNLVPGTGETSEILARAAVERAVAAERPMRILYISDFDPGGRSMPVGLARKIEFILRDAGLDLDITLEPILLLPEQCEDYRLPRTPIKTTERRGARFEQRFGEGATELDALEALHPGEMAAIVERECCRYIDPTLGARCRRAFWELGRGLQAVTAEATAPYEEELDELNARYAEIQGDLQTAIDVAREDMEGLETAAAPLWRRISADLEDATPEIDPADVPTARPADPVPDPLFDSSRDYLDQLDRYHLWQGRYGDGQGEGSG